MRTVALDSVNVLFGGVRAVRDVTLEVRQGERVAIVGPNGAGKSTLLHTIGGQIRPSSGTIRLFEEDVTTYTPDRRAGLGLARTFQITNLFGALTVESNVALAAYGEVARFPRTHGVTRWPKETLKTMRALIEDWNLHEQRASRVADNSYGEQRTLETVMALARRPRLLLFDEPSAGMSKAETDKLIESIDRIDRSITVIVIEHDLEVVRRIASRVVVLQEGQVVADGTPEQIAENPVMRKIYWFEDEPGAASDEASRAGRG